MIKANHLILIMCGIIVGMLAVLLINGNPAQAQGSSSGSNDLIAVTGKISSSEDVVYIIGKSNTAKDGMCRFLAVYQLTRDGLQFLGSRKIEYDLQLTGFRDATTTKLKYRVPSRKNRLTPGQLKAQLKELNKKANEGKD